MAIPSDIGLYMLEYAHSLADYIGIKKKFDIPDKVIEEAICSEIAENMEGSSIEKLYRVRYPEPKYILNYVFDGHSQPHMVDTKSRIIEQLTNGYGSEWNTKEEKEEYRTYYTEQWNPQLLRTEYNKIQIIPLFDDEYDDKYGYYISGPI